MYKELASFDTFDALGEQLRVGVATLSHSGQRMSWKNGRRQ